VFEPQGLSKKDYRLFDCRHQKWQSANLKLLADWTGSFIDMVDDQGNR